MGKAVSIVLPTYNEELAIGRVIDDVEAAMAPTDIDYELIVVDDGSTDRTAEIAQAKGTRVIRHPENRGSGSARKTGILEAVGEIIVMIDTDGTYSAHSIPEALGYFPEYDQVSGVRTDDFGKYRFLRKAVKWLILQFASYPDQQSNSRPQHRIQGLQAGLGAAIPLPVAGRFFLYNDDHSGLPLQRPLHQAHDDRLLPAHRAVQVSPHQRHL